ncbi:Protein misato [Pseudolycoriella hygida]|uniref:Protein misato n=1 Tax=Pseudolycoriella hygida TaxID=35572 RepID=A0A9Q0MKR6_9DIPT|nr:Protein misato [Pseudolycoriella hygida]KAJ6629547.1 Protein misato [Pseudolycoriella hygida]
MVDLKGSLRHCPENGLYEDSHSLENVQDEVPWDSNAVEVLQAESVPKPKYQKDLEEMKSDTCFNYDFKNTVKTWTDFAYTRLHPRSVTIVNEFEDSLTEDSFDCFTSGASLWQKDQFENDFCDKVRQYIEECNNCQGFQMLYDCTNGFSGLASKCLDHLEDEYSKTNFTIPTFSPNPRNFRNADTPMSESIRVVNIAMSFANLFEHSSLVLPLSTMSRCWRQCDNQRQFPFLTYDQHNLYETSSLLAVYLDTISMKYRLKDASKASLLSGFCSDLCNYGRKLVAAALALPLKLGTGQNLIDCLDEQDGPLFTQLTPNANVGTDRIVQSVFVRGIPQNRLKQPLKSANHQIKMAAYQCNSVAEMLQLFFQCNNYASMSHVSHIDSGFPIKLPFPTEMFDQRVQTNGWIGDVPRMAQKDVNSAPVLAVAQVSSELSETIESLHREAKRIKVSKIHRFKETGLEDDDISEVLEKLLEFKDNYDEHFEL